MAAANSHLNHNTVNTMIRVSSWLVSQVILVVASVCLIYKEVRVNDVHVTCISIREGVLAR